MAVQKSRKTPSRRGMRRSHDAIDKPTLSVEPTTGPEGYYKGKKVIEQPVVEFDEE